MGNILTYLKWRGDLPFVAAPFNEADNLILSELSYLDFAGVVPGIGSDKSVTVKEAFEGVKAREVRSGQKGLLEAMSKTERFGGARLKHYQEIFETDGEGIQFGAVEIVLSDGSSYISFRGTDFTIVGWKEDFELGYKIVPAQKKAVEYLTAVMEEGKTYRLGGHSKGGNLAVFGAMMCPPALQQGILKIYSNDGPGLCRDLTDAAQYEAVRSKIIRIVPEFSVIGQLFEDGEPDRIVKSESYGLLQHNAIYWQIEGDAFVEAAALDKECVFYNGLFDEWMENVGMEEREIFVSNFFEALASSDAISMDKLAKGGPQVWEKVLISMKNTDKKAKKTFVQLLGITGRRISGVHLSEVVKDRKAIPWLCLLATGIFFLAFPLYSTRVLGTAAFLCLFACFLYKALGYEKQRRKDGILQNKEIYFGLSALISFLCMISGSAAVIPANAALCAFFAYRGYRQGKRSVQAYLSRERARQIFYAADAVIASGFCVLSLVFLRNVDGSLILAAGSYLIAVSAVEIGRCIVEKAQTR